MHHAALDICTAMVLRNALRGGPLDGLGIFIMLGIAAIVVVAIFIQVIWQDKQMNQLLSLASKRLGGQVVGKGMGHPELRIEHAGIPGTIKFYKQVLQHTPGRKTIRYSVLQFELPSLAPFAMHLCATGFDSDLARIPTGEPSPIGDPTLDKQFGLRTTDPRRAQAMLGAETKKAIGRLRALEPLGRVEIFILERELIVRFATYIKKPDSILGLGFMGYKILDGFLRVSGWAGAPAPDKTGPLPPCRVCHQEVAAPGQVCAYCGAVVHPDCWQLADTCPTCGAPTAAPE